MRINLFLKLKKHNTMTYELNTKGLALVSRFRKFMELIDQFANFDNLEEDDFKDEYHIGGLLNDLTSNNGQFCDTDAEDNDDWYVKPFQLFPYIREASTDVPDDDLKPTKGKTSKK